MVDLFLGRFRSGLCLLSFFRFSSVLARCNFALFSSNHIYYMSITQSKKKREDSKLTPPHILPSIHLMMNLLLDQMLMSWILRIQHHNRLPPSLPRALIAHLERRRRNQHGQRQALRVHPRLHQLLRLAQVRIASHQCQCDAHGRDPRRRDDGVAVFAAPGLGALEGGGLLLQGFEGQGGFVAVGARGVAGELEGARGAVGGDDGGEGGGGGAEEGFHGEGEGAEGGEAGGGAVDCCYSLLGGMLVFVA